MIASEFLESHIRSAVVIQAAKYVIVGGVCTILDFTLLFLSVNFFGLNYVIASIISFMFAAVLNYYLCVSWIFDTRVVGNRYHEFLYYALITGIGLGINTTFIWGLTQFFGIHFMLSKIPATLITFVWNFGARKYFLHSI